MRDPRSSTTQEKEDFHIFLNKGHSCEKAPQELKAKEEKLCKIKKKLWSKENGTKLSFGSVVKPLPSLTEAKSLTRLQKINTNNWRALSPLGSTHLLGLIFIKVLKMIGHGGIETWL